MTLDEFKKELGEKKVSTGRSGKSKSALVAALQAGPLTSVEVAHIIFENRSNEKLTVEAAAKQAPMRIAHLRKAGYVITRNADGAYELTGEPAAK